MVIFDSYVTLAQGPTRRPRPLVPNRRLGDNLHGQLDGNLYKPRELRTTQQIDFQLDIEYTIVMNNHIKPPSKSSKML